MPDLDYATGTRVGPAAAVGRPAVEEAGGGGGGGVAGTMLLDLSTIMEKCVAPRRAAIMPLRRNSGGVPELESSAALPACTPVKRNRRRHKNRTTGHGEDRTPSP